eukprot:2513764-Rhodomonas_salina.1
MTRKAQRFRYRIKKSMQELCAEASEGKELFFGEVGGGGVGRGERGYARDGGWERERERSGGRRQEGI